MSGHSKWATTKHKKAVVDARRGKLFAKLIKNVEVAARTGGGDPAGNPTLADAIQKAKSNSVPNDNIDRAVRRGAGLDAGGADYESIMYEGYGPGGVGAPRRRGRPQGVAACRRARGERRRAERLGQLRRQRRGSRSDLRLGADDAQLRRAAMSRAAVELEQLDQLLLVERQHGLDR